MLRLQAALLALTLVLLGCSQPATPGNDDLVPPDLTVWADGEPVKTLQGSYTWGDGRRAIHADSVSPEDMIRVMNYQPPQVLPGARVTFDFAQRPQRESLSVEHWQGNVREPVPLTEGSFFLPESPGVYLYSLHARWQQGSATYVFQVEVPPPDEPTPQRCGSESFRRGEGYNVAARECLLAAYGQGESAVFYTSRLTVEGDPVYTTIHVRPGGRLKVIRDTTQDYFGESQVTVYTCTSLEPQTIQGLSRFAVSGCTGGPNAELTI